MKGQPWFPGWIGCALLVACTTADDSGDEQAGGVGGTEQSQAGRAGGQGGFAGETQMAGGGRGGQAGMAAGAAGAAGQIASGGTPATGGQSGGGGTAGMPGTGPAEFKCAGRAICTDFESMGAGGPPDRKLGSINKTGASQMYVDDKNAYSGERALRVEAIPIGTMEANVLLDIDTANVWAQSQSIYVRMMIYPEERGSGEGHFDLIQAWGDNKVAYGQFGGFSSKLLYFGGGKDCSLRSRRFLLPKRWTCIEFKIDKTHATEKYGVWMNQTPLTEFLTGEAPPKSICVKGTNNWNVPDIKRVSIGYRHYHPQLGPLHFWVDDLAIDSEPIGCPKQP